MVSIVTAYKKIQCFGKMKVETGVVVLANTSCKISERKMCFFYLSPNGQCYSNFFTQLLTCYGLLYEKVYYAITKVLFFRFEVAWGTRPPIYGNSSPHASPMSDSRSR